MATVYLTGKQFEERKNPRTGKVTGVQLQNTIQYEVAVRPGTVIEMKQEALLKAQLDWPGYSFSVENIKS